MDVMPQTPPAPATSEPAPLAEVFLVFSSHWDREWYEPFQGFRYRLVRMLDDTLTMMEGDERISFQLDGQAIPIEDYLEVRPERAELVRRLAGAGRLAIGPWYVQPDEFIPSGESLVRNLQEGLRVAAEYGKPSRVGFLCDIFGHNSQMPQILRGFGIDSAYVIRGTNEATVGGQFRWRAPDGSEVLAYRFGPAWGYGDFTFRVRSPFDTEAEFDRTKLAEKTQRYIAVQQARGPAGLPVMLFDGSDHMEIEPGMLDVLGLQAPGAAPVRMGTLDEFAGAMRARAGLIQTVIEGELREVGQYNLNNLADLAKMDEELWQDGVDVNCLIPGVLASRIPLKQANARCESVLTQWAEPFAAFAAWAGQPYPEGFLHVAWRHLLANHAHDSICGCSIDQVHEDMVYRFNQAELIGQRLRRAALEHLAGQRAAQLAQSAPAPQSPQSDDKQAKPAPRRVALFNPTAEAIDEPVDFTVEVDADWPSFNEFFGYEPKPAFRLVDEAGAEVPYQRTGQTGKHMRMKRVHRKFPKGYEIQEVQVTARVRIPAFGLTLLGVESVAEGPTRYGGAGLVRGPRQLENEWLAVEVSGGGLVSLTDKRTGQRYERLLELEDCADIGDGWYHGMAVNDRVYYSGALSANVAVVADGPERATLRIEQSWPLPERFDFARMRRAEAAAPLRVVHELTLRAGATRLEVRTTVDNAVEDHRLRVLFPSGAAQAEAYLADGQYDVLRRPIALDPRNHTWRELEVETRPQQSWTAVYEAGRGLAVVSQGLPESAVLDQPERPIALTLLRAFKKAVFTDGLPGGQIQGQHEFQYWIVPLAGEPRPAELCRLGQRLAAGVSQLQLVSADLPAMEKNPADAATGNGAAALDQGFLSVEGEVVVTAVKQSAEGRLLVRLFNPGPSAVDCTLKPARPLRQAWLATLEETPQAVLEVTEQQVRLNVASRRILCVLLD